MHQTTIDGHPKEATFLVLERTNVNIAPLDPLCNKMWHATSDIAIQMWVRVGGMAPVIGTLYRHMALAHTRARAHTHTPR